MVMAKGFRLSKQCFLERGFCGTVGEGLEELLMFDVVMTGRYGGATDLVEVGYISSFFDFSENCVLVRGFKEVRSGELLVMRNSSVYGVVWKVWRDERIGLRDFGRDYVLELLLVRVVGGG
jgi:hypothetical protein